MLKQLNISNYVLIERAELSLENGFTVVTGETGAGKSILLGALHLLAGAKADAKMLKCAEEKCIVEGIFSLDGLLLDDWFSRNEIETMGKYCILRREIYPSGKSRAFINDSPTNITLLKELSDRLVDIHSQHQNLLLGHGNFLLSNIDAVAEDEVERNKYTECFSLWRSAAADYVALKERAATKKEDEDYLEFQCEKIEAAQLREGELEELEDKYKKMSHVEDIRNSLTAALDILDADEMSPISSVQTAGRQLMEVADLSLEASQQVDRLESVAIELEDIRAELENLRSDMDFDGEAFQEVEERLNLIYSLQKKFGLSTISEINAKGEELRREIDDMQHLEQRLQLYKQKERKAYEELKVKAKSLSLVRKEAAIEMQAELIERMRYFGMPSVKMHFDFKLLEEPTVTGMDGVTFLFSANKHVEEEDVARCASGGEIARLMLALKVLVARKRQLPTVIFDEIDTGVSGLMAEKMGRIMEEMGHYCQVLCITHLPQIAALGNAHYKVRKYEAAETTVSVIEKLDKEGRLREIADMLSGIITTDAAVNNAKKLLNLDLE